MLSECRDAIQAVREELKPDQVGRRLDQQLWPRFGPPSAVPFAAGLPVVSMRYFLGRWGFLDVLVSWQAPGSSGLCRVKKFISPCPFLHNGFILSAPLLTSSRPSPGSLFLTLSLESTQAPRLKASEPFFYPITKPCFPPLVMSLTC